MAFWFSFCSMLDISRMSILQTEPVLRSFFAACYLFLRPSEFWEIDSKQLFLCINLEFWCITHRPRNPHQRKAADLRQYCSSKAVHPL